MNRLYSDELGAIQIFQGNSYEYLDTVKSMPVSLMLTDPPYGIDQDPDKFGKSGFEKVVDDDEPFDPTPFLSLGFPTVMWGANNFPHYFVPELWVPKKFMPAGGWLCWDKTMDNSVKVKISDGELAWCNTFRGIRLFRHLWSGAYRATESGFHVHPTQKPVALMRWVLDMFTEPGDLVFDPFMGSGPIAQACHEMERRYIGIELNPDYCAIAIERVSVMTIFGDP